MPRALRLGANPPFQRVEETKGACKKARLFAIVRVFCCVAASWVSQNAKNIYVVQWIPACAGMTNTCHPRPDRGAMPSSMVNTRLCGYDKEHRWYAQDKAGMTKSKVRLGNIRTTHLLA